MHVYTDLSLTITASYPEVEKAAAFLDEKLDADFPITADANRETNLLRQVFEYSDYAFAETEEVQEVAVELAKEVPSAKFVLEGSLTNENGGGEESFSFKYAEGKLTWEVSSLIDDCPQVLEPDEFAEEYPTYEDFAGEFCDDDGEPLYTEEQFNALMDAEVIVIAGEKVVGTENNPGAIDDVLVERIERTIDVL